MEETRTVRRVTRETRTVIEVEEEVTYEVDADGRRVIPHTLRRGKKQSAKSNIQAANKKKIRRDSEERKEKKKGKHNIFNPFLLEVLSSQKKKFFSFPSPFLLLPEPRRAARDAYARLYTISPSRPVGENEIQDIIALAAVRIEESSGSPCSEGANIGSILPFPLNPVHCEYQERKRVDGGKG